MQNTTTHAPRSINRRALTVNSQTTPMGNRFHAVATRNSELGNRLYERALNLGHEPEISRKRGALVIEFFATDADLKAVVQ